MEPGKDSEEVNQVCECQQRLSLYGRENKMG